MNVGAITFGPTTSAEDRAHYRRMAASMQTAMSRTSISMSPAQVCNCIGPQAGEKKCPCALTAEAEQGLAMIRDGVVINGRKYRLVPEGITP